MTYKDIIQILVFLIPLILLTKPIGKYIYSVISDTHKYKLFSKIENIFYRLLKIDMSEEMNWKQYLISLLWINVIGFAVVFLLQIIQGYLPLNPQKLGNVNPILAFNTAVSFMTNTNWQAYSGENTLSYLVQMLGLTVQNFLSASTGICVFLALVRGIKNKMTDKLGNFWIDVIRITIFVLLPFSIILSIILVGQGVVQNFLPYTILKTVEGSNQVIPMGPAASQIAIKQLGTNGGGFFGVNSAFPLENPTAFSNLLQMLSILLIPAALTYTYGKLVNSTKQGWVIFSVMLFLLVVGIVVSVSSEFSTNTFLGLTGNMEGKEMRFGITNSAIWSSATTAASNGSVNAMHDSLNPLSALVAFFNMMLGEIIFGGVGSGMYGMLIFVFLTVFIAGLMVGRTPEYLGKKIQAREVQMSILAVIVPSLLILLTTAITVLLPNEITNIGNTGSHGFSEILYTFTSAAANNGSSFSGLNANSVYYNVVTGINMLAGRFAVIVPVMVIAGSLSTKKTVAESSGTFRTDNTLFAILLIGVIIIIGSLTFFPALSLGPIVEQLMMI